jgi:hypothetical protein
MRQKSVQAESPSERHSAEEKIRIRLVKNIRRVTRKR